MNWLNIAFVFIFATNAIFLLASAYLLYRILGVTTESRNELHRAVVQSVDASVQLKLLARHAMNELEREDDAHTARENSNQRAINGLTSQVKSLLERIQRSTAKSAPTDTAAGKQTGSAAAPAPAPGPTAEDIRAKLHADLNAALAKNHQLQDEVEQMRYRLKDVSFANSELKQEISEVKGLKQSIVDNLTARMMEMDEQLEKARARANLAEVHAKSNATQLDDIRDQIDAQPLGDGVDQSGLIDSQNQQIDALALREKQLMSRIDQLEQAMQRTQAEKGFIEEKFLQLDSSVAGAANAGGSAADTKPE